MLQIGWNFNCFRLASGIALEKHPRSCFSCQLAGRGYWFMACGHNITMYSKTFILKRGAFKYVNTTIYSRIQGYLMKNGSRLSGRLEMDEPNGRC
jgi:hypothetical protein